MFWSETIDVSTFTSLWMETSVASRFASNISGINSIGIFDKGKKKKKKKVGLCALIGIGEYRLIH